MFRLYSCPYLRGYFRPQLLLGSGPISRTSSPPCSSSEAGKWNVSSYLPFRRALCTKMFLREALWALTVNFLPRP